MEGLGSTDVPGPSGKRVGIGMVPLAEHRRVGEIFNQGFSFVKKYVDKN
jgi:hypothetical protein